MRGGKKGGRVEERKRIAGATPGIFWNNVILGDFKSNNFVRMHSKGLAGAFFVRVDSKGLTGLDMGQTVWVYEWLAPDRNKTTGETLRPFDKLPSTLLRAGRAGLRSLRLRSGQAGRAPTLPSRESRCKGGPRVQSSWRAPEPRPGRTNRALQT